nr:hypothetical protein MFMH1_83070 [Myxococcus sp. MH1]
MARWHDAVVALMFAGAFEARAESEVFQFRTQEDATKPADAAACAAAPFEATVKLGAGIYVPRAREQDGKWVDLGQKSVGTATACLRITPGTPLAPGNQVPAHMRFVLPEGTFAATGTCNVVSNDVPVAGLVLAGCALKLVEMPAGYVGGTVSSTSSFNPKKLPGYATGSYYTLLAYRGSPPKAAGAKAPTP